jgi:threonine synthase
LREDFEATYSSDEEGEAVIAAYAKKGYIMDPHTATCLKAYNGLRAEKIPTIIYSTAEWTKFSMTVSRALGHPAKDDLDALKWVSENSGAAVPGMISSLFDKPIRHSIVVDRESIKEEMLKFL